MNPGEEIILPRTEVIETKKILGFLLSSQRRPRKVGGRAASQTISASHAVWRTDCAEDLVKVKARRPLRRVSAAARAATGGCVHQGGSTEVGEARRRLYVGGGEDRTCGRTEQER